MSRTHHPMDILSLEDYRVELARFLTSVRFESKAEMLRYSESRFAGKMPAAILAQMEGEVIAGNFFVFENPRLYQGVHIGFVGADGYPRISDVTGTRAWDLAERMSEAELEANRLPFVAGLHLELHDHPVSPDDPPWLKEAKAQFMVLWREYQAGRRRQVGQGA